MSNLAYLFRTHICVAAVGMMAAISISALSASTAYAGVTNLLTNGDFSTCSGTPSGWSTSGMGCDGFAANQTTLPVGAANWISTGGNAFARQTFSDVNGATYTVDGWIKLGSANASVTIDSVPVITAGTSANGSVDWTQYSGTFIGTGSDTINLVAPNIPGFAMFTEFSVASKVPEPGPLGLLGFAVSILGITVCRRPRPSMNAAATSPL
jgi:hypothetical protein